MQSNVCPYCKGQSPTCIYCNDEGNVLGGNRYRKSSGRKQSPKNNAAPKSLPEAIPTQKATVGAEKDTFTPKRSFRTEKSIDEILLSKTNIISENNSVLVKALQELKLRHRFWAIQLNYEKDKDHKAKINLQLKALTERIVFLQQQIKNNKRKPSGKSRKQKRSNNFTHKKQSASQKESAPSKMPPLLAKYAEFFANLKKKLK